MSDKKLNIIFAGTPEFAAKHLEHLIANNYNIIACYTQPDRPAGRGKKLQPSAVKKIALEHNIPVCQPQSLKTDEALDELSAWNADLMIVVAYGLLLPKAALDAPKYGCINVHGSLLPKWRGAAPIQRSVLTGDAETGVTIMQMDVGLDTGDMLLVEKCDITDQDTSSSIYEKLQLIGPNALTKTVDQIEAGTTTPVKQDDALATYAHKLTKQEALIDWTFPAIEVERAIRGYQPWPVAYTNLSGNTVKVLQAEIVTFSDKPAGEIISADKTGITVATASGAIKITQLQPQGKKPMSVTDFINGRADWVKPGTNLLVDAN
ncbi:methionyl-tRNA formyltransferase [Psychrosphaera aquimarina]|uniref:Methionyl-tRNA formyltransferase n=1 Tax=Psychrosphaera aquimarina TaxID=2044854 RepID=A0ABU3QXQ6_9GAMM|nr:methionyl-tRNA formyltransferase [Psychrosphaera aquimarina]MDU0112203.1 methionyl-tRNA formyltransferase [Psychrosphaera aquimarina]